LGGIAGIGFHLNNNWEFEREIYPNLSGLDFIWKVLTGAIPVTAPGSLIVLVRTLKESVVLTSTSESTPY